MSLPTSALSAWRTATRDMHQTLEWNFLIARPYAGREHYIAHHAWHGGLNFKD